MGSSSSKASRQKKTSRPVVVWSNYQTTGNSARDRAIAIELVEQTQWDNLPQNTQIYQQARRLDPTNAEYARALAFSHLAESDYTEGPAKIQHHVEAEKHYAEAFRLGLKDYSGHSYDHWAIAVIGQGLHRKADEQQILQWKQQYKPKSAAEEDADARQALKDGDHEKAIAHWNAGYKINKSWKHLDAIASCYLQWKGLADDSTIKACQNVAKALREEKATWPKTHYDSEFELNENFYKGVIAAAPHFQKATLYKQQDNIEVAAESGARAVLASSWQPIVEFQAGLLYKLGRFKECARLLKPYKYHGNSALLVLRGDVFFQERRYTIAGWEYSRAADHVKNETEESNIYARWRECDAAKKSAIDGAKEILSTGIKDPLKLRQMALFFYYEKEHELAIDALQQAIAITPQDGQLYGDLGDSLWLLKRKPEAESYYQKAIKLDSSSPQSLIWQTRTGFNPTSSDHFADELKWDASADTFGWIGSLFVISDYAPEDGLPSNRAVYAYETALDLAPDHPDAPLWKEKLAWIDRLVQEKIRDQAMRRAGKDPLHNKIVAQNWLQNYGYGVYGSQNQNYFYNQAYNNNVFS